MFARQWFGPSSQLALQEEALTFESLLRNRDYCKAIELASANTNSHRNSKEHRFWIRQRLRGIRLQERYKTGLVIGVAFDGFWPGFKYDDNEIFNLLQHAAAIIGAQVNHNYTDPDLLIYSCFGNPSHDKFSQATRLLYLGENVRPDFSDADYSMTFDMASYCGRNIYVPLWLLRSSRYAAKIVDYQFYDAQELEESRTANRGEDAVVYIGNNMTANRIEAINELRQLGIVVDCFGSQTRPVANKIETLRSYQYNLCFENSYTPGYVTEKIVDSFLGGSHPIYWGGAPQQTFNLSEFFVCDPYQSTVSNMKRFSSWKRTIRGTLPPLLKKGAFAKIDSSVLRNIARILMDLF
jgi:hypothetical protein